MSTRQQSWHAESHTAPPLDRLLTVPAVVDLTSLSKATVYRKVADGSFPAPLKIGKSRVAWREQDIADWVARQPRAT
jgi:prophage regulatory protein